LVSLRDVSIRQLRAVAAIARTGKITLAASELCLTPPAVTEQLKLLEDRLGLRLFQRTRTGLKPTDAGLHVIETAARMEALLAGSAEQLRALKGLAGGRVIIGVVGTAKYYAPRLIAAFAERRPKIELQLRIGNRAETIAWLRNYEIDVAIMGRPPEGVPVRRAVFGPHPHVVIAPPCHPLTAECGPIERRRLAGEKMLVREVGSGTRLLFERMFTGIVPAAPSIRIEIGSNETIKQAVMAGLGLAFISAHTIELEVQTERLAILNIEDLPVIREWCILHREDKELTPAAAAFWQFVLKEGRSFLPRINGIE
jgi:LysR family transcriptional regulator, low CO2-responsive transcriptional regulator